MSAAFCVGLTGGIGCGKSTVAELFAAQGAGVIDTDAIALQLTQSGGAAMADISQMFGSQYLTETGALDRAKMRHLIFSDDQARFRLQRLLHPLILESCKIEINQSITQHPYLILAVPLLLETPEFRPLVQRVLVVDCSLAQQIERVRKRSGLAAEEIRAIIARQISASERLAQADDIIHNDGLRDDLPRQVADLHRRYSNHNNKI